MPPVSSGSSSSSSPRTSEPSPREGGPEEEETTSRPSAEQVVGETNAQAPEPPVRGLGEPGGADSAESVGPDLFEMLYGELHAIARAWFRNQPLNHTLQPTALVHEAYLRLVEISPDRVRDRTHFLATAARAMRQILVDHARRRNALKRGGGQTRVPLDQIRIATAESELDLEVLHDALEELGRLNPRQAEIVELRFFGGLTVAEAAEVLGIASRTVKLDWQFARAWLLHECEKRSQSDP